MPKFVLPDPGEGLVEAEIVAWKVKAGDQVKTNDIVVEVETAKSLVELPIPFDGVVRSLLAAEGEVVEVGNAIIDIDDGNDDDGNDDDGDNDDGGHDDGLDVADQPPLADDLVPQIDTGHAGGSGREANLVGYGPSVGATTRRRRKGTTSPAEPETQEAKPRPKATPPVRKYAKDRGVDLTAVQPSREDGVIMRSDIDAHASAVAQSAAPMSPNAAGPQADGLSSAGTAAGADVPPPGRSDVARAFDRSGPRESRVAVKGVRKMTASAMVGSAFSAPHATEFITVDVSATMELVERLKGEREFRDLKVSPLLLLAKAVVVALRRHPQVNAAWEENAAGDAEIVHKHYVNLGIAAATPRGLIVPTIKDADLLDMRQLAEALDDLITTARAGRTQPAQMSGGTITITNVGVFGVDTGTPILNPGESMIVCFGAVRRQPWVVARPDGSEAIEPRWVTQLAVSFDHRLIDGELGSRFLADLAALLHDPSRALVWG